MYGQQLIAQARWLKVLLVGVLALVFFGLQTATPAQAAPLKLMVPIVGGNIEVHSMGGISTSSITWLVQIADRSTCTTTPVTTACNGFMSPGDRVIIGDSYMAFMDLTRTGNQIAVWGNGGGGLLRGFWLLRVDGAGNRNFLYLNNHNHAPNNLFPYKTDGERREGEGGGDGLEILFTRLGDSDPWTAYRASESASVTKHSDGVYYFNNGDPYVYYHFQGIMTQGNGNQAGQYDTLYNQNAGTSAKPTYVYYHLHYRFYNNEHVAPDPYNKYRVNITASVDVCGSTGCNDITQPIGMTFSLGLSRAGEPFLGSSQVALRYVKSLSHDVRQGAFKGTNPDTNVSWDYCSSPDTLPPEQWDYKRNVLYEFPTSAGDNIKVDPISWLGQRLTQQPFSAKYSVDVGSPLSNLRLYVKDSTISSNLAMARMVYQQVAIDHENGGVIIYDTKVGNALECGLVPNMPKNSWISWSYDLIFNYDNP